MEFLCAGTDAAIASLLQLGIGGRNRCVPLLRSAVSWPAVSPHALSRSMLIHKKTQEFKQAWFLCFLFIRALRL